MTMLEAVYVDTVEERRIVAIRPKLAFRTLLEIARLCLHAKQQTTFSYPPTLGRFLGDTPSLGTHTTW